MNKLIKGIHHVSLSCKTDEELAELTRFYGEILEMEKVHVWDGGIMLSNGGGIVEIMRNTEKILPQGTVTHFALATDDVDECIKRVRDAGYEVTVEPQDVAIPSDPVFPFRMAFCLGPIGEEIEFFCEK